jgi:hypothetical protein
MLHFRALKQDCPCRTEAEQKMLGDNIKRALEMTSNK